MLDTFLKIQSLEDDAPCPDSRVPIVHFIHRYCLVNKSTCTCIKFDEGWWGKGGMQGAMVRGWPDGCTAAVAMTTDARHRLGTWWGQRPNAQART